MITAKATKQEPAPNQTYALFWFSGTWDASGLRGLTRSIENQPELILAVALLAVPHPHQLGRPSFSGHSAPLRNAQLRFLRRAVSSRRRAVGSRPRCKRVCFADPSFSTPCRTKLRLRWFPGVPEGPERPEGPDGPEGPDFLRTVTQAPRTAETLDEASAGLWKRRSCKCRQRALSFLRSATVTTAIKDLHFATSRASSSAAALRELFDAHGPPRAVSGDFAMALAAWSAATANTTALDPKFVSRLRTLWSAPLRLHLPKPGGAT